MIGGLSARAKRAASRILPWNTCQGGYFHDYRKFKSKLSIVGSSFKRSLQNFEVDT
jgi:hypothetical protein